MKVVAVYNLKGGVGKTTTAVNLSFLAAAGGSRVLLWDLDPQGAASFAFRVRPRVEGFSKKSLENGRAFADAVKATDYPNLDLLPADFAYRKLDRFLDDLGKPKRMMRGLIEAIGREYDVVFLDCPAGFSLVSEGIFAGADAILVPTVPGVLSLRSLVRLMKWADRSESTATLAAFFSMVDRRKTLHRLACEWSRDYPDIFFAGQIPYASVVEQMPVRRMPLAAFAPRDAATTAFAGIWSELESRLQPQHQQSEEPDQWTIRRRAVEALMERLESPDEQEPAATSPRATVIDMRDPRWARERPDAGDPGLPADGYIVHRFDTTRRDLEQHGHALELHERHGSWVLITSGLRARIDRSWAFDILSGKLSPLAALERRIGGQALPQFERVRMLIGDRELERIDSRLGAERADDSARQLVTPSVARPAVSSSHL